MACPNIYSHQSRATKIVGEAYSVTGESSSAWSEDLGLLVRPVTESWRPPPVHH